MNSNVSKLFVLYIPSLDRRRVDARDTPYVHELLARYPSSRMRTMPTTELVPTMFTGRWPHEHKIWQVQLKDELPLPGPLDLLPDLATTTWQCLRHFVDSHYDLAAIPRWRRRRFNLFRYKYTRRGPGGEAEVNRINDVPTVFGALGDEARYMFGRYLSDLETYLDGMPSGDCRLEFLEFYGLDLFSHWNLDDKAEMGSALRKVDAQIRRLHEACRRKGVRLMLIVDHGQERVERSVDLRAVLEKSGVPRREYTYLLEVASARLWFHTENARRTILPRLSALENVTVKNREEMREYDVRFEADDFGEVYAIADAGTIFFPHDFYQPIANFYMGWKNHDQRSRLRNPRHRGYHGHLPHFPSEEGWILLADDAATAPREIIELVDVAPTMMRLVGRDPLSDMRGREAFALAPVRSPAAT